MGAEPRPMVVVDASVAVKWLCAGSEHGVQAATDLLERHIEGDLVLVAPSLLAYEVLNVVHRKSRGANVLADTMEALFDLEITFVEADRVRMIGAAKLVQARGISTFDAAYAALAASFDAELATADRRLANALGGAVNCVLL